MDDDVAIKVEGVSKYFPPSKGTSSLKAVFTGLFKSKDNDKEDGFWALEDINFEVKKGEFFGIVGRNGSGKSTLLKMMAGVYTPTSGSIQVNGKLVPFIELGVGFNPELTGRDNVFLNGALLGFSRKEMEGMYDEIVAFAELEDHMNVLLKNYSSGMQVRLAFSIAIRADSEILLLDEVLAVGDTNFQKKCFNYFKKLKRNNKTVILVTHDISAIKEYCDKGLLISDDEIPVVMDIDEVIDKYLTGMGERRQQSKISLVDESENKIHKDKFNVSKPRVLVGDKLKIDFEVEGDSKNNSTEAYYALSIKNLADQRVVGYNQVLEITTNNSVDIHSLKFSNGVVNVSLSLDNVLIDGKYSINIGIINEAGDLLDLHEDIKKFIVKGRGESVTSVQPNFRSVVTET